MVAAVVFAVALVASSSVISGAAYVRRPVPVLTVQMAGSSAFFSDPVVQAELLRQGFVVQETSLGSRQVCGEPLLAQRYDVAIFGTQDSAACVLKELTSVDHLDPHKTTPFSSPMVIITYSPIVQLLEQIHVVTMDNGIAIFNVLKYLAVVHSGVRWAGIKGNYTYLSQRPILVATTDPRFSNSGGMFAAIAYAAQNGDDPVTDLNPGYLSVIKQSFAELGSMDTHTPDLVQQFLTEGMDALPMAMVYEDDYVFAKLSGEVGPGSQIMVMYPDPDVISDDTLVSWTPGGNKMTSLLTSPAMVSFEEEHGYRTSRDSSGFVNYMAPRGIKVPSLNSYDPSLQFVSLPTETSLKALINAVVPGS
jgi:hypothetical protein